MTRGILVTGAVLAALGVSALAASAHGYGRGAEPGAMNFGSLDADGDGLLTPEEMAANRAARFAAADVNSDGFLSADEMQAAQRAARAERIIARMDTDGDGLLSLEEMTARRDPAWMFDRLDANEDGAVSAAEFEAMHGKALGSRGWGHKRHGKDHAEWSREDHRRDHAEE